MVLLVGPPGTGKSTLTRRIAPLLEADVVQTDAIRKALVKSPTYLPAESAWVHRVAQQRLRQKLQGGRTVIFDATNLRESYRRPLYALADELGIPLLILVCWAPESVVKDRLAHRQREPHPEERSDADWAVYLHLRASHEPVLRPHTVVNSTVDLAPVLRGLVSGLQ